MYKWYKLMNGFATTKREPHCGGSLFVICILFISFSKQHIQGVRDLLPVPVY